MSVAYEAVKQTPPEVRLPTYTDEELFALDAPRYKLSNSDETVSVPKIVYDMFKPGYTRERLDAYLALFNLTNGAYDRVENPRGVRNREIRDSRGRKNDDLVTAKKALLLLTNTPNDIRKSFFGLQTDTKTKNGNDEFSTAFLNVLDETRRLRNIFPFENRKRYPLIDKQLREIEQNTGLTAFEIFTSGSIPPLHGNKRSRGLAEVLNQYSLIVAGNLTTAEIAKVLKVKPQAVNGMLSDTENSYSLTERARQIGRERLKKNGA